MKKQNRFTAEARGAQRKSSVKEACLFFALLCDLRVSAVKAFDL